MLHEAHASLEQKTATSVYFDSIHQAKDSIVEVKKSIEKHPEDPEHRNLLKCIREASPFLVPMLYQVACAHLRIHREYKSKESFEAVALSKMVMRKFNGRWKAAGKY